MARSVGRWGGAMLGWWNRRGRGRGAILVAVSGLLVVAAALIQHLFVLGYRIDELQPRFFVAPLLVGTTFGALIAHLLTLRARQAQYVAALAEREREIVAFNRELEQRVAEGVRKLHAKDLQLLQAQKMDAIGRLAGGVAHDFNNVLAGVLLSAAYLERVLPEGHRAHDIALEIQSSTRRAVALTRQLLAFSRKQVLRPRAVDLNRVVTEMLQMLRRLISEGVALEPALSDEPVVVWADPTRMEQVVLNLVTNAADAVGERGTIRIVTGIDERRSNGTARRVALLAVEDDGCGMDEETQRRIFEPFFTTKAPGQGTGLGLSVVYGIARQSDAELTVTSRAGEGTTITISMPLSAASVDARSENTPPPVSLDGRGETILVVEDDDALRLSLCRTLEHHGYRVLSAAAGDEALAMAAAHEGPVELLLSDVVMPRMNGFEVARALREQHVSSRAIFITGRFDEALRRSAAYDSSAPMLEKPIDVAVLLASIRKVLDSGKVPSAPRSDRRDAPSPSS